MILKWFGCVFERYLEGVRRFLTLWLRMADTSMYLLLWVPAIILPSEGAKSGVNLSIIENSINDFQNSKVDIRHSNIGILLPQTTITHAFNQGPCSTCPYKLLMH